MINRSNDNVRAQRIITSSYVIEQLDTGEIPNLISFIVFISIQYCFRFLDDNEIQIEESEKQFSPKRKKDVKAIEGYVRV